MTSSVQFKPGAESYHAMPSSFQYTLPEGYLTYDEFKKSYQIQNFSTEQLDPKTMTLSQTMHKDIIAGLKMLSSADEAVIKGHDIFASHLPCLLLRFTKALQSNGRIIFIGSGSSGRAAVDLAKKCKQAFPDKKDQVLGKIAGEVRAMKRPREGFEDSVGEGERSLGNLKLNENDIVVLISASGSAPFNVGAGHYAADCGARVYYFYNNKEIPLRTETLFRRPNVEPLCVDTGPQPIGGSTRTVAAGLAQLCLGTLLGSALLPSDDTNASDYPSQVLNGLKKGNAAIATQLKSFQSIIQEQLKIRSNPLLNQGYVTVISLPDSLSEICIETSELPPTFNEPDSGIRAYMLGKENNLKAWQSLVGTEIEGQDQKDIDQLPLSTQAEGPDSFAKRPMGKGNMVIGVIKLEGSELIPKELETELKKAQNNGASTAMIVVCDQKLSTLQLKQIQSASSHALILDGIPQDPLGLSQSLVLKQALNMLSNATMTLEGKVHGNRMINMRASNNKLLERCMGLIKTIWAETHQGEQLDDRILYHYVIQNDAKMKANYDQFPPIIAITLAMLHLDKTPEDFDKVVNYVRDYKGLSFLSYFTQTT